jgi:hypothetical protein
MISAAEEVQREAMEVDERQGMVEEYLDTLLPENWESMDTYARRNYLSEKDAPTSVKGTVRRTRQAMRKFGANVSGAAFLI